MRVGNPGHLFEVKLVFSYSGIFQLISFSTNINGRNYSGSIFTLSSSYTINGINNINWNTFVNSAIGNETTLYYQNNSSINLYEVKRASDNTSYNPLLASTPNPQATPPVYGNSGAGANEITRFKLYMDTTTHSGILLDSRSTFYIDQLRSWSESRMLQGFTNYMPNNYINSFLIETNRPLNSELFRLIGANSKVIAKKFYRVEISNKVITIHLNADIEVIGYTITTGLYSHLSDANSWKVFGMKNNKWILLDKQDKYDIPVERSYTLPPFYFNSKKNLIKDSIPDIKIIEDYYNKKINPFGKAVFKKYMFDDNKTYYMVFDEYDNNRNLIDTDLIIGFVMGKGVIKKPVMYENPDGSFDAFNLKKKEMMAFWKKKIGLKLETKYLSDY